MNAHIHAELSCRRWKLKDQKDYNFFYSIHDFMDCSKEVESSNLHRLFLHSMWAIKRVVIPIFGATYTASNGNVISIKDDLESNHIIADFAGKYLPNLSDYFSLLPSEDSDSKRFHDFGHGMTIHMSDIRICDLMFSPQRNTGMEQSLYLTHNTWFVGEILPKIFPDVRFEFDWSRLGIRPADFLNRMKYDNWLNNGRGGMPPSYRKLKEHREKSLKTVEMV